MDDVKNEATVEELAEIYANSADGNPIDEFTLTQKLLMRTAYIEGFKEAVERAAKKFEGHEQHFKGGCDDSVDFTYRVMQIVSDNIRSVLGDTNE